MENLKNVENPQDNLVSALFDLHDRMKDLTTEEFWIAVRETADYALDYVGV